MKNRWAVVMIIGIFAFILTALQFIQPAHSQVMCAERSTVVKNLEKTYSEAPVSIGLASNGSVIEILASPSGSFTIILTQPNGMSCVMAAGESWENIPKRLQGGSKI